VDDLWGRHSKIRRSFIGCKVTNNISVVILTYNEELNLQQALNSVKDWADEILILDSQSNDKTIEIAQKYGCTILINPFVNFAKQRNFALQKFSISSEWTLFLDADEWVTEQLKEEIKKLLRLSQLKMVFTSSGA